MTFNSSLAHRVMEQIRRAPERHTQEEWRCESGMCFAGWVAELQGYEWANEEPNGLWGSHAVLKREKLKEMGIQSQRRYTTEQLMQGVWRIKTSKGRDLRELLESGEYTVAHASDVAAAELGISEGHRSIFAPYNTRSQLEMYVNALESGDKKLLREAEKAEFDTNDPAEWTPADDEYQGE